MVSLSNHGNNVIPAKREREPESGLQTIAEVMMPSLARQDKS